MKEVSKESAYKSLARRPKLIPAIEKGKSTIVDLKKIGEVSGGFIRTLIWSGLAQIEGGLVSFTKAFKKSSLPDLEKPAPSQAKTKPGKEKDTPKGKETKGAKKTGRKPEKQAPRASKKEQKKLDKAEKK